MVTGLVLLVPAVVAWVLKRRKSRAKQLPREEKHPLQIELEMRLAPDPHIAIREQAEKAFWLRHKDLCETIRSQEPRQSLDLRKSKVPTAPPGPIRDELVANANDVRFRDPQGRQVILRGINLSGSCKVPTQPNGATHLKESLAEGPISFAGRPLGPTLEDADEHLIRLRAWGFNFLRLLTTWESVEHEGPGIYDEQYLAYLLAVVRKCRTHGFSVFIDPHQDCWSRFSGGDGAPRWTLELLGFDLSKTDAATGTINHAFAEKYPNMVWGYNNRLIVARTMWTVFFAGDIFCPDVKIQGEPAQQFLQGHFCAAMKRVAEILKDEPNVLGFQTLNEPDKGFVGEVINDTVEAAHFTAGPNISSWTSLKLGVGIPAKTHWNKDFAKSDGERLLNPDGVCCWSNGPESCIWRQCGVYTADEHGNAELVKPEYFLTNPSSGEKVESHRDCLVPFWCSLKAAVWEGMGQPCLVLVEPFTEETASTGNGGYPDDYNPDVDKKFQSSRSGPTGWAWCPHFYDGVVLLGKRLTFATYDCMTKKVTCGMKEVLDSSKAQIKHMISKGKGIGPTVIGEIGIPMDMRGETDNDAGAAFRTGDWAPQIVATDMLMKVLEELMISSTWWNYTHNNCNAHGDLWNLEDLSIWSKDQQKDPHDLHSGGRTLETLVRPYAHRIAGEPLEMIFHPLIPSREFLFRFKSTSESKGCTVIFVPQYQYPNGVDVQISDGSFELKWDEQTLLYTPADAKLSEHCIRITHKTTISS